MMDTASLNDSQIINQCQREHKDAYRNVPCIRNGTRFPCFKPTDIPL